MSLADRTPQIRKGGPRHRVAVVLEGLPPEDREALLGWLNDLRYTPERIVAELAEEGISVHPSAVARYRHDILQIGTRRR